jgi:hypothetical protein
MTVGFLAGLLGCQHSIDRLTGGGGGNHDDPPPAAAPPAASPSPLPSGSPSPAPSGSPPASPAISPAPAPVQRSAVERYQFTGVVVLDGSTAFYKDVTPGDTATGSFEINFNAPVTYSGPDFDVYAGGFQNLTGSVHGYPFYTAPGSVIDLLMNPSKPNVDTGIMVLDGRDINFDLFLIKTGAPFPNRSIENLRNLDRIAFDRKSFWLEIIPQMGQGFSIEITGLSRVSETM